MRSAQRAAWLPAPSSRENFMTHEHRARKDAQGEVSRRKFLAGVAVAGAAPTAASPALKAATRGAAPDAATPPAPSALPPPMQLAAAAAATPKKPRGIQGGARSDVLVD